MIHKALYFLLFFCSLTASAQQSSSSAMAPGRLQLFSDKTRQAVGRYVLVVNFVDRYFSQLKMLTPVEQQRKLKDDKVLFVKGRLELLYHPMDDLPCTITRNEKFYEVSWLKEGKPVVDLVFPVQYELLTGQTMAEAQQQFRTALEAAPDGSHPSDVDTNLKKRDDGLYTTEEEYYEERDLNNARYYYKKGGRFIPVFNGQQPVFSAANLFQGITVRTDYQLHVVQTIYGPSTVSYQIPLEKWLGYCEQEHLTVFFGIEEERTDSYKVLVVAHSKELGFNHLLSVDVPRDFIDNRSASFDARLTPFIPTHNLKYKK